MTKPLISPGTLSTFLDFNSSHTLSVFSPSSTSTVKPVVSSEILSFHSFDNGSTDNLKSIVSGTTLSQSDQSYSTLSVSKGGDNEDGAKEEIPNTSLDSYLKQFSSIAQARIQKQVITNESTSITCPSEDELTEDTSILQSVSTGLFSSKLLRSRRDSRQPGTSSNAVWKKKKPETAPLSPNTFATLDECTLSCISNSDTRTFVTMDESLGLSSLVSGVSRTDSESTYPNRIIHSAATSTTRDSAACLFNGLNSALLVNVDDSNFSYGDFNAQAEILKQSLLKMSGHSISTLTASNVKGTGDRRLGIFTRGMSPSSDECGSSSSDEDRVKEKGAIHSIEYAETECSSILSGYSTGSFGAPSIPHVPIFSKNNGTPENSNHDKILQTTQKLSPLASSVQEEDSESGNSFASCSETVDSDAWSLAHTPAEPASNATASRNLLPLAAIRRSAPNRSDAMRLSSSEHPPLRINQRPGRIRELPAREERFSQSLSDLYGGRSRANFQFADRNRKDPFFS